MYISFKQKMFLLFLIPLALGFLWSGDGYAADKKDKAARRNALMMQKMQQEFEAEKASMQAQFEAQKKEMQAKLDLQDSAILDLEKKLASTESALRKSNSDLKKTSAELDTTKTNLSKTQTELDTTKATLADLNTQHQKSLADLAFNDNQRKTLSTNLADTTKSLNACVTKNEALYQYGKSLVQLYDNPSQYEAAMRKEKFLQLKRVELENILQDKMDLLDASRVGLKAPTN